VTSHLFHLTEFFNKIPSKNNTKCIDKLLMAEKVRIMAWKEEGIPSTATEGRLCRHCTSKKASSLRQGVFPLTPSLRDKKNGPATCQLSKDMETICVKKT
jgi:hypothetical protein